MKRKILTDNNSDSLMSLKTGSVMLERDHISIDTMEDVQKIEELL